MAHIILNGTETNVADIKRTSLRAVWDKIDAWTRKQVVEAETVRVLHGVRGLRERIEIAADVYGIIMGKPMRVRLP